MRVPRRTPPARDIREVRSDNARELGTTPFRAAPDASPSFRKRTPGAIRLVLGLCAALATMGAVEQVEAWTYPIRPYVPGSYAYRVFGGRHLGEDVTDPRRGETPGKHGMAVRAMGPGVIEVYRASTGYGQLVVVIEHDLGRPYSFPNYHGTFRTTSKILSIYGHLRSCQDPGDPRTCTGLNTTSNNRVQEGDIIGYINISADPDCPVNSQRAKSGKCDPAADSNGDGYEHLHLGIRLTDAATAIARDWRFWFRGYTTPCTPESCPPDFREDFAPASEVLRILGAGTNLIDIQGGPDKYWRQNSKVYHVLTPDVIDDMASAQMPGWGWSFASVDPTEFAGYTEGPGIIAGSSQSDGLLIRDKDDALQRVYAVQNGKRRWIRSADALNGLGPQSWFPDVIEVPTGIVERHLRETGNDIYGVGEGETNASIKQAFRDAYAKNASDAHCQSPSTWKGWPGQFSKCLDFPIGQVRTAYVSGASGISGKYQTFGSEATGDIGEKGTINHSAHGTFAVHGEIYQRYKTIGFSRSKLGFPTGNEFQWGRNRRSNFEGGYIYWSPTSKRTTVRSYPPASRTLTVTRLGSGSGIVTSGPAGISCPGDCSNSYSLGTIVVLAAQAWSGSRFAGWSGEGCSGTGTCAVTMNAARSVTATFNPVSRVLRVSKSGSGSGIVTSTPAGISCGSNCYGRYFNGTTVVLAAQAWSGSTFAGWSGEGCSGTGTCTVTMNAARSVAATFNTVSRTLSVFKSGSGGGTVTSAPAGISCGSDCYERYSNGTTVVLAAQAWSGSTFAGWSGEGCSGTGTCTVTVNAARSVTATFNPVSRALRVFKSGGGSGTVTSAPAGISCGSDCYERYSDGTTVVLAAQASGGSKFAGWSGEGCSGTNTCTVTMNAARSVTATFNPRGSRALRVTMFGSGDGTVTSNPPGIHCPSDCSQSYSNGTYVALRADAANGSTFTGWSGGGCSGTGYCVVSMTERQSVSATFASSGPELQITSPRGGQSWAPDTVHTIKWTSSGLDPGGVIYLYYWDHDNDRWRNIARVSPSTTSYHWSVPMYPMRETAIWVGNRTSGQWKGWDRSGNFLIPPPTIPLYRVTVQNLTRGQALTPPVIATHRRFRLFRVGRPASAELQALAENGNEARLVAALGANDRTYDFRVGTTGSLVPGSNPGGIRLGSSVHLMMTGGKRASLSMASKLACTNDGFTGFGRLRLPGRGARVLLTKAHDAGTELATEDFADIVPSCQTLIGITSSADGTFATNPALAEGDVIRVHPGIYGGTDLLPEIHGWTGPVARVTVTRVRGGATRFSARLRGTSEVVSDPDGNHTFVDSVGRGRAVFRMRELDSEVKVVLKARRIHNVTQAHIHLGLPDDNGPIVATLFASPAPVGYVNGRLVVKILTESDLVGVFAGDFSGFVEALGNGEIYVDVHTTSHPAGEIRGQIGPH